MTEAVAEASRIKVPTPLIVGAGVLMLCGILLAGVARWTGAGRQVRPVSEPAAQREVVFQQLPGNVIRVLDGSTRALIATYGDGEGGMVRGSLRAFAYQRKVKGATLEDTPFRLTQWKNGMLTLEDPVTSDRIELDSFGPDNRRAFAALLP